MVLPSLAVTRHKQCEVSVVTVVYAVVYVRTCYLYSQLFGLPMVLKPTSCWKLDWEDLESNTNNFAAVCKLLKERVSTTHVRTYMVAYMRMYTYV